MRTDFASDDARFEPSAGGHSISLKMGALKTVAPMYGPSYAGGPASTAPAAPLASEPAAFAAAPPSPSPCAFADASGAPCPAPGPPADGGVSPHAPANAPSAASAPSPSDGREAIRRRPRRFGIRRFPEPTASASGARGRDGVSSTAIPTCRSSSRRKLMRVGFSDGGATLERLKRNRKRSEQRAAPKNCEIAARVAAHVVPGCVCVWVGGSDAWLNGRTRHTRQRTRSRHRCSVAAPRRPRRRRLTRRREASSRAVRRRVGRKNSGTRVVGASRSG